VVVGFQVSVESERYKRREGEIPVKRVRDTSVERERHRCSVERERYKCREGEIQVYLSSEVIYQ
jgi:hypothetical protein